ncbi:MAG TPA: ABC transporter permease [Thermoanaerobaculia bacterium]|nr:ABC transporter permease [Thermoanaerobaculia bacterium]
MLATVLQDLRYAARTFRQSPGFLATAVASLALGIGLSTTLFTIVDAVLWRPLPVADPERLVSVFSSQKENPGWDTHSVLDTRDLAAQSTVLTGLAGHSLMMAAVTRDGAPQMAMGEVVTGNYFDLMGVRPRLGRLLSPADDVPGAAPVVVLSSRTWNSWFGADPQVIGQSLKVRGVPYTVVGVAPERYTGLMPGLVSQLWVAASRLEDIDPVGHIDSVGMVPNAPLLEQRGYRWLQLKGRLKPGVTLAQAQANLEALAAGLAAQYPDTNEDRTVRLLATTDVRIVPDADRPLRAAGIGLLVVVSLVLLVASANVANMLLARASNRRREVGMRLALGAGRGRLLSQLLTESLFLAGLGALAGLALAWVAVSVLRATPLPLPIQLEPSFGLNLRVFLFAFGIALGCGLVFGLAPAREASRPSLLAGLKNEASDTERRLRFGLKDLLVIGQVTVTLILLVGAGLLTKSLASSLEAELGMDTPKVAVATFSLDTVRYTREQALAFHRDLLDRLKARPEIAAASFATRVPLGLNTHVNSVFLEDRPGPTGEPEELSVDVTAATPGYLDTLGIPLVAGRDFTASDVADAPRVAIVNQAFVDTYWPGQNALGKRFRTTLSTPSYEVVGVTADYKIRTVGEKPRPFVHFAAFQRNPAAGTLLVRTRGDVKALPATIEREIAALTPDLPLIENRTFDDMVGSVLLPARLGSAVLGILGLLALALAAVGLYGVIAYSVARRTQEIGIRMAIGAEPANVLNLVLRQGLRLVGIGLAIGLAAALLVARLLAGTFYGLSNFEPGTFALAAGLLVTVATIANLLPARRAARLDPLVALRRG